MDLRGFIKKINAQVLFSGSLKYDEPMSSHTTFKTGGPADLLVRPDKSVFAIWTAAMLKAAKTENIPVFVFGGGANLLVSDKGIRGIVLDMGSWEGIGEAEKCEGISGYKVKILAGTQVKSFTETLADRGFGGLEFLAGMPGTAGGAVWMNARCYEKQISDVLIETEILDENYENTICPANPNEFSYKKSPFQKRNVLILSAVFNVMLGDTAAIKNEIEKNKNDRMEKGHYRFPSAGSVFKNNHEFGEPTGKIIADLGMRGMAKGGAQIAPWHGNFIINTGSAVSADIRFLMEEIILRVRRERGFELEPEIILAGDWS